MPRAHVFREKPKSNSRFCMKGEKFITGMTVNLHFFEEKNSNSCMHSCIAHNKTKMPGEFLIFASLNCCGNKKI